MGISGHDGGQMVDLSAVTGCFEIASLSLIHSEIIFRNHPDG